MNGLVPTRSLPVPLPGQRFAFHESIGVNQCHGSAAVDIWNVRVFGMFCVKKTAPRQKGRSESSVEFSRSTSVLQTQQVLDEIIKLLAIFQRANKTFGHDRDIRFDDVLNGFVRNRDGIRLGHVP